MRGEDLARWAWWLGLGLIISLAVPGVIWGNELVLYDPFETPRIHPDKWFSSETRRPNAILEASRFVKEGKLYLIAVGYGGTRSNAGRQTGSFGLGVNTPRSITGLQAELTVTQVMAQTCAANAESTQGRAQLVGFFFNDGSGRQRPKGDLTGDVVAVLEKVADSRDGQFIRAIVLRCTSWTCGTGETIKALLFKHRWELNQPDVLRMAWEPLDSEFVFSVNPGGEGRKPGASPTTRPFGPASHPSFNSTAFGCATTGLTVRPNAEAPCCTSR